MTRRLTEDEDQALRRRAELAPRSLQDVARQAVREYVDRHRCTDSLHAVLGSELTRDAEALQRLAQ